MCNRLEKHSLNAGKSADWRFSLICFLFACTKKKTKTKKTSIKYLNKWYLPWIRLNRWEQVSAKLLIVFRCTDVMIWGDISFLIRTTIAIKRKQRAVRVSITWSMNHRTLLIRPTVELLNYWFRKIVEYQVVVIEWIVFAEWVGRVLITSDCVWVFCCGRETDRQKHNVEHFQILMRTSSEQIMNRHFVESTYCPSLLVWAYWSSMNGWLNQSIESFIALRSLWWIRRVDLWSKD